VPVQDVYNMQLSNEPAEELAKVLVDSGGKDSNGQNIFELCGFVSGGSEAMEGVIKLARQVSHNSLSIGIPYQPFLWLFLTVLP
jgi:adenosylmethionine-8-amino-7-oxononanoate aminotransferase